MVWIGRMFYVYFVGEKKGNKCKKVETLNYQQGYTGFMHPKEEDIKSLLTCYAPLLVNKECISMKIQPVVI